MNNKSTTLITTGIVTTIVIGAATTIGIGVITMLAVKRNKEVKKMMNELMKDNQEICK